MGQKKKSVNSRGPASDPEGFERARRRILQASDVVLEQMVQTVCRKVMQEANVLAATDSNFNQED